MSKKTFEERKKDSNHLKIIFSVLIMGISFLAELYTMVILEGNPIYLAIFGLVFLLFSYILISSIMQNQYIQWRMEKEDHEGLLKSEKASYLIVKKSFDEIFQRLENLERGIQLPTEELITAQKAIAKVNINRSKENTDALMNSNDMLLEKVMGFEQVLNNNNQKLLDGQNQNMEQQLQDVILKQQELSSAIKEVQLSLKNEILQAVNMITTSQPQVMVQSPVTNQSSVESVTEHPMEDSLIAKEPVLEESLMQETVAEEPLMEEPLMQGTMAEEPLMEEPLMEESVTEVPLMEEPLMQGTVAEEPLMEEPLIEESVTEVPLMEEPLMQEPMAEEPLIEEPLMQEPITEEPLMEEALPEVEIPMPDLSDPNKMMDPDDIAALIANVSVNEDSTSELNEPIIEMEEAPEEPEEPEEEILIPDMSDPNKMMSPDEIAALIANL